MSKSRNLSRFQKKSIFKAKHLRSSTRQVAEAISKERRRCYTPPEEKKNPTLDCPTAERFLSEELESTLESMFR